MGVWLFLINILMKLTIAYEWYKMEKVLFMLQSIPYELKMEDNQQYSFTC